MFLEGRKSRPSDFRVILRPRLSVPLRDSGISRAFVVRYSGATVRDLHPVPYSPGAVATGTRSHTDPQYFVALSKNYTRSSVFSLELSSKHFRMSLSPKRLRTFSHSSLAPFSGIPYLSIQLLIPPCMVWCIQFNGGSPSAAGTHHGTTSFSKRSSKIIFA